MRFWSKFRFRQKWYQIKGLDKHFQKMAIKNCLGQVKRCFGHNKVEILPISIRFYFVKGQPIPQCFILRFWTERALSEHTAVSVGSNPLIAVFNLLTTSFICYEVVVRSPI